MFQTGDEDEVVVLSFTIENELGAKDQQVLLTRVLLKVY